MMESPLCDVGLDARLKDEPFLYPVTGHNGKYAGVKRWYCESGGWGWGRWGGVAESEKARWVGAQRERQR